jgi:hypothetical protein
VVIQWQNKELREDIIKHVIEEVKSGTLSDSTLLESIEKKFATMDNIELLLAFSHANRKTYIKEYFSGIILCVKELFNANQLGLPQPSMNSIYKKVIFDRRVVREIFNLCINFLEKK